VRHASRHYVPLLCRWWRGGLCVTCCIQTTYKCFPTMALSLL
jgi:hypothetical protein